MVIFPTRILYCDSDSPAILGFFLSFEARTCSTVALCNICRANGKPFLQCLQLFQEGS